jgi:hypothetical protein
MNISQRLINGLARIQSTNLDLPLVPLNGNKQPLGERWQDRPLSAAELIKAIDDGGVEVPIGAQTKTIQPQGFGILTGRPIVIDGQTYYLMALDQDGEGAAKKILSLGDGEPLPTTVAFTSGRPGRCQYLFLVPSEYAPAIKTKKIKTGAHGDDGKEELLEFRWKNLQSVLPPSVHPTTGEYRWIDGCAIDEMAIAPAPTWVIEQMLIEPSGEALREPTSGEVNPYPDSIQIPVPAPIPLLSCCRIEVRDWVNNGVTLGAGRNDTAISVGLELIAVERYLQQIGQPFSDSARQLFSEYCQRSGMTDREDEERWNWCYAKNPTPSCGADGIEACIRGWKGREFVKPAFSATQREQFNSNSRSQSGQGFDSRSNSKKNKKAATEPQGNNFSILESIRSINETHDLESLRVSALMDLAIRVGRPYRDLETLARIVETEGDLATEVAMALDGTKVYLNSCRKRLDLLKHLEHNLADLMKDAAESMPTAPEYLLTSLLSASSSRVGTSVRAIVNPDGGYAQPLIFWTANVAQSGQAKTPPQQVIVQPLEDLEIEAYKVYCSELKAHQQLPPTDQTPPPKRKRFILNNVTTPVKIRIHHDNPRGLLEYIDEMASDFTRLNQFKGGKGDDLEQELKFFNGGMSNYDRSDVQLLLPKVGFSKTGTFQWETLATLMKDAVKFIASGYAARFLFCSILDAPPRYLNLFKSSNAVKKLQSLLRNLYEALEKLPEMDYLLTHEAKVLFQAWNHTLVDAEIHEPHFALSLVYPKIESYTVRIALWLHLVNSVLSGVVPAPFIDEKTMKSAIEIASFYLWQHKLIYAYNSPTRQLEGLLLKVQTQAEKFFARVGEGVKAWFLKQRINGLKNWSSEKIRTQLWKPLEAAGFGRIEGDGSTQVYIPLVSGHPNNPNNNNGGGGVPPNPSPDGLGGLGGALVEPPRTESGLWQQFETILGGLGGKNLSSYSSEVIPTTVDDGRLALPCEPLQMNQPDQHPHLDHLESHHLACPTPVSVLGDGGLDPHLAPRNLEEISQSHLEVEWLMELLADLEATNRSRFLDLAQLNAVLDEANLKASGCIEQLNRKDKLYHQER